MIKRYCTYISVIGLGGLHNSTNAERKEIKPQLVIKCQTNML